MRRVGILLLAVIALIAMTGPVSAQPKVTITGFVDNVTSITNNMSVADINPARTGDKEWYARTRVRPDITAEVGTTKFVLGLEFDAAWGQTGATDVTAPNRSGASSSFDLNTDLIGVLEVKWAYTEFRMPLMPVPTTIRIGAQPWQAQYKLAALANGDFAGVHVSSQLAPVLKLNATFAQAEEATTGTKDGFIRGDDVIFLGSIEITPFKGLDIRPIFSYANFIGVTSGAARTAKGGVGTGAGVFQTCPGTAGPATGACAIGSRSSVEDRFTVGVDARWRFGPFSLDPTAFYQFGKRDQVTGGVPQSVGLDAWFFDLRGGWQAGPLLLEAAGIYTTGNSARQRTDLSQRNIEYYQPISTDTSFYATWAEIWALGIDYFNIIRSGAGGLNPGASIGYDKYGLIRAGFRGSYALTPAFTLRSAVTASWTAEEVDTSSTLAAATGLTPGDAVGDARFLGTEVNVGFQWRFAPNVALDVVGSYMWAGNALATHLTTPTRADGVAGVAQSGRNPQDISAVSARVRYSW